MAKRRNAKRKTPTIPPVLIQRGTTASTSSRDINNRIQNHQHRPYCHPYATRSKTLRTAQSSINVDQNDYVKLKRRQSDTSIVFLGTYRKVPQLIVLEESSEGRCIEFVEKPESLMCLKAEKMDYQTDQD